MIKTEQLLQMLEKNKSVRLILKLAEELNMPNWYLGAGGIAQTVWNIKHGFDLENGIKDYDLVYYDADDTSYEAEDNFIQKGKELFKDISVLVEIRNQARVHLWFKDRFKYEIKPYQSAEESIESWSATASCVGVRHENGKLKVFAPFGLNDIFDLIIRPNKLTIFTKELYDKKTLSWSKIWPKLKVIPWGKE